MASEKSFDFVSARARLEAAERRFEARTELPRDAQDAVLQARARRLAKSSDERSPAAIAFEGVGFRLGSQAFALSSRFVQEMVVRAALLPVPAAPRELLGLMLLRGEPIAVVEVSALLGVPPSSPEGPLLLLGEEEPVLALRVDGVEEVVHLRSDQLQPPPAPSGAGAAAEGWLSAVTADGLSVLDGAAVLSDPKLFFDLERDKAS